LVPQNGKGRDTPRRRSRVPAGRVERLARLGWLAGGIALGGVAEGVRRFTGGEGESANPLLTRSNAERLARRLSGMRGAAMKLGQLLSMESEDLLPGEFAQALAMLRADGDAMPDAQLQRVLRRAFGRDWETRFREFDFEPIAAASIGQVHRAVAADGRRIALKIQYPGISRSIESDVENLATAFQLTRLLPGELDLSGLIAEAKRQLRRESDYRAEARNLRHYAELLAGDARFVVPGVHEDLTTVRVLAMDHLPGVPLEDLCGSEHGQERRDQVARRLLRLLLREIFEFRYVQTDPNLANYLWMPEEQRIGLLDLGAARRRREAFLDFLELAAEPFRSVGVYDFGASDLAARARDQATRLAFRHGFLRPPPAEILFVQRKLGGTFLLCVRLRARVDLGELIDEVLGA
jgi:predicted unusual protein kinase regulating ubiquinone biosynthesis (AarF/ABC1/UbiB family)